MSIEYVFLIVICLIAIYSIYINLKVIGDIQYKLMVIVCTVLFIFSSTRYVTLIIYGDNPMYSTLESFKYFYYATSIGLTGTTLSALWYATPLYREKIKYPYLLLLYLPFALFYLYVIITQPTTIVKSSGIGYEIILNPPFQIYLAIVQGTFVTIVILASLIGIFKYKNMEIRTKLILIILAQILLTLDGLGSFGEGSNIIPPFTLTEAFAFWSIYYTISKPVKNLKSL